jgi:glycosyltransferase involved in cell wall biosynthesis
VALHELRLARSIDPIADLRGLVAVHRLIAGIGPDIVHLHSSKAGVLGRVVARLMGRAGTTFYSPRGLSFLQQDQSRVARGLYRMIERAGTLLGGTIVACSASEREIIAREMRPARLALVENAVDVETIPLRHSNAGDALVVGIAGRVTYARNARLFANMAQRFGASGVRFVWVGGGAAPETMELERSGVTVTGWMSRHDALAALSTFDIYLHPSRWEGMPIALIEAQVCGLPAVATDVVGNRDVIVDGETGFLCVDADSMANALGRLIGDAALRERMGARARELALPRFNLDRLVGELEMLYRHAVAARDVRQAQSR